MAGPERPLLWSREARHDLADIWQYYLDTRGQIAAEKVVRGIVEACHILEEHPLSGRDRSEVRQGFRSVVTHQYVIFYRISASGNVEIVRVLDGRRDADEIFPANLR